MTGITACSRRTEQAATAAIGGIFLGVQACLAAASPENFSGICWNGAPIIACIASERRAEETEAPIAGRTVLVGLALNVAGVTDVAGRIRGAIPAAGARVVALEAMVGIHCCVDARDSAAAAHAAVGKGAEGATVGAIGEVDAAAPLATLSRRTGDPAAPAISRTGEAAARAPTARERVSGVRVAIVALGAQRTVGHNADVLEWACVPARTIGVARAAAAAPILGGTGITRRTDRVAVAAVVRVRIEVDTRGPTTTTRIAGIQDADGVWPLGAPGAGNRRNT
jgi:hypothetical protein